MIALLCGSTTETSTNIKGTSEKVKAPAGLVSFETGDTERQWWQRCGACVPTLCRTESVVADLSGWLPVDCPVGVATRRATLWGA